MLSPKSAYSLSCALGINVRDTTQEYSEVIDTCNGALSYELPYIGNESINDIISVIWNTIKTFFRWVIDLIKSILKKFTNFIKIIITKIKEVFNNLFRKITDNLKYNEYGAINKFADIKTDPNKIRLEIIIDQLKEELRNIPIENYVSSDKLKYVQDLYNEISKVFTNIISNVDKFTEYAIYSETNGDTFEYIANDKDVHIEQGSDLYKYITAETQKYGIDSNIYEIMVSIVPEMFSVDELYTNTNKVYNDIINKLQTKATFISDIFNEVSKKASKDLEYLNTERNNKNKQVKYIEEIKEYSKKTGTNISEYIDPLLNYLKRIILIFTMSLSSHSKCFNVSIGAFADRLKEFGIRDKSNNIIFKEPDFLQELFKKVKPIARYDSINVYNSDTIQKQLANMLGALDAKASSAGINASCFIAPNSGSPILIVSGYLIDSLDKDTLRYVCYHEIGHFVNGHKQKILNLISLRMFLNKKMQWKFNQYKDYLKDIKNDKRNKNIDIYRNNYEEIQADIYIIERHIYTPAQVLKCINKLIGVTSKYLRITIKDIKNSDSDLNVRKKYMEDWVNGDGRQPPLPEKSDIQKEFGEY